MSAPAAVPDIGPAGRLGKLMAAVRSEFRSDVLEFAADDPVFGGAACRIAECGRTARGRGLCQGHLQRWSTERRPDMEVFVATTDPRWRREQPNQRCRVADCGYGVARKGLCALHAQRWDRVGQPDLDGWVARARPVKQPSAGAACRIPHCRLWPQATSPFCHTHTNTWRANGRPGVDEFADHFADSPLVGATIRLDRLAPHLRLEVQYVLQRRHDDRQAKLTPDVVMRVVRRLADANLTSLLDHDEQTLRERIQFGGKDSCARDLLGYAFRTIADLAETGGWEAEYPRDVWRMHRLGYDGDRTLRFTGIDHSWLRELAKRWVRWRLAAGLGLESAGGRPVVVLTRFARFLTDIGIDRPEQIDRAVLERYLADIGGHDLHDPRRP